MTPREIADTMPGWMADALMTDEASIERLPFRQRDELISYGLAVRAWPKHTADKRWHTWITPLGVEVREIIKSRLDAFAA